MTMLTDTSIRMLVNNDNLISNFEEDCLTPAGYDLRVGHRVATAGSREITTLSTDSPTFSIPAYSTSLISTLESIKMPQNREYSGLICSKVSLVSKGLSHVSTTVDADYNGTLLIAMHNHSSKSITLSYKQALCTLVLLKNEQPSTKLCNKDPNRNELFLESFSRSSTEARSEKHKQDLRIFAGSLLFLIAIGVATYCIIGPTPAFTGIVAMSVFIVQFYNTTVKK